jgi:hypothetical protein
MEPQDIAFDYNLFNKTRKKRREPEPVKPKRKVSDEPEDWKRHLEKGDILFKYMLENLDSMLNEETLKKHFYIVAGLFALDAYDDDVYEAHGNDILENLRPWIQNEFITNRLFNRELWRQFREAVGYNSSYLGYKKMFSYRGYLFQLIIDNTGYCTHFELALFDSDDIDEFKGSKVPGCLGPLSADMMFPEDRWNIKNGGY